MLDLIYKITKPFNLFSKYERDRIKRYFKKRMIWMPVYVLIIYLFVSYSDFITNQDYDNIDMMIDYLWPSRWEKDVWDVSTFLHVIGMTLGFTTLYIFTIFFVSLYHFTQRNWYLLSTYAIYISIDLNITYWDLFFYFMEKSWTAIGILYFIYFWVYVGLQWAVDMEEDIEFDQEQKGVNTDRVPEMWLNTSTWDLLQLIVAGVVFKEPDSVSTLKKRYEDHKKKAEILKGKNKNIEVEEFVDTVTPSPRMYTDWEKAMLQTQKKIDATRDGIDNIWKALFVSWCLVREILKGNFPLLFLLKHIYRMTKFYVLYPFRKVWYFFIDLPYNLYIISWIIYRKTKISFHWVKRIVLSIIWRFYSLIYLLKLIVVNLLGRNSRVYVVGPYSFYDPFFNRASFKRFQEKENTSKLITWILGKRYYGVENTSKWNISQKRLSLKLFKKIEKNIKK